jgi:type II secretory ATPase GspE/PulE/Tfp pilus assembly ATPase PilB-like protein
MSQPDTYALTNDLSGLDLYSGSEAVDSRLNAAQMLSLIDSILPFEACLYHEIIPLSVESSCLYLGMVNPSDTAATDYARKQGSFIHCSVVSRQVSSDWQRKMLSKYLSHKARHKSPPSDQAEAPLQRPTAAELLTFIVDSPDELPDELPALGPVISAAVSSTPKANPGATPLTPAAGPSPGITPLGSNLEATPLTPTAGSTPRTQPLALTLDSSLAQIPLRQLHRLPPSQLTQALLYQVLNEGIGRLYLERRPSHGRVLWSKDGIVQAALKDLSLDQMQSVINELKRLLHLPLLPTTELKKADIERLYQGDRVLLRLRLIPGTHGEEATLQVLRGAALKFYQQQQFKQLEEDALGVAQTLQKRITEIRQRSRQTLSLEAPSTRNLESLCQLLKTMEEQIEQIVLSSTDPNQSDQPVD